MSSEIIQSVAYDNYDDFHHVMFIFSQIFISLFGGLCNVAIKEKEKKNKERKGEKRKK
jgi:hypothetical protein